MKVKISKEGNANVILLPTVGSGTILNLLFIFLAHPHIRYNLQEANPHGQCKAPSTTLGLLSLVISFRSICKELR